MMYFAYGSNLDPAQWRERCPASGFVAVARLAGHGLAFPRRSPVRNCAVASVVPATGRDVWGVLYAMDAEDLAALDRREGWFPDRPGDSRYRRAGVIVESRGERIEAVTYVAVPSPDPGLPSVAYLRHIVVGARHHRLPEEYIAMLEAIPALVDA